MTASLSAGANSFILSSLRAWNLVSIPSEHFCSLDSLVEAALLMHSPKRQNIASATRFSLFPGIQIDIKSFQVINFRLDLSSSKLTRSVRISFLRCWKRGQVGRITLDGSHLSEEHGDIMDSLDLKYFNLMLRAGG